jgi:hypothetical protein
MVHAGIRTGQMQSAVVVEHAVPGVVHQQQVGRFPRRLRERDADRGVGDVVVGQQVVMADHAILRVGEDLFEGVQIVCHSRQVRQVGRLVRAGADQHRAGFVPVWEPGLGHRLLPVASGVVEQGVDLPEDRLRVTGTSDIDVQLIPARRRDGDRDIGPPLDQPGTQGTDQHGACTARAKGNGQHLHRAPHLTLLRLRPQRRSRPAQQIFGGEPVAEREQVIRGYRDLPRSVIGIRHRVILAPSLLTRARYWAPTRRDERPWLRRRRQ